MLKIFTQQSLSTDRFRSTLYLPISVKFDKHIEVKEGIRLLDLLAANTGLSKTVLKDCLNKGAVWLKRFGKKERRVRRAKLDLIKSDRISIYYDQKILNQKITEPVCLSDQTNYTIWDKPVGMLSQGTRYGDHCSLLRFAEKMFPHRATPHLVHRLDREAQGVILLAHGKKSASLFSELFRNRRIRKRYRARVYGTLTLENKLQEVDSPLDGKPALTAFKVIRSDRETNTSLIDIEIHTGRYHQIRRHLSGIGHPLVGDSKYNTRRDSDMLQLEAYELEFTCPFSKTKVCCRLPSTSL